MNDPYQIKIGGVLADPYRIARAYSIDDPIIFQALKKLLRAGRKHKNLAADVREAITTLERWEEMQTEDQEEPAPNIQDNPPDYAEACAEIALNMKAPSS